MNVREALLSNSLETYLDNLKLLHGINYYISVADYTATDKLIVQFIKEDLHAEVCSYMGTDFDVFREHCEEALQKGFILKSSSIHIDSITPTRKFDTSLYALEYPFKDSLNNTILELIRYLIDPEEKEWKIYSLKSNIILESSRGRFQINRSKFIDLLIASNILEATD